MCAARLHCNDSVRAARLYRQVRCGGPYGGYLTEWDFYRSMFRTTRNSPFALLVVGLLAIPAISMVTSAISGSVDLCTCPA